MFTGEILPVGNMVINPLSGLKKINSLKCQLDPDTPSFQDLDTFVKQNPNLKIATANSNYGKHLKNNNNEKKNTSSLVGIRYYNFIKRR